MAKNKCALCRSRQIPQLDTGRNWPIRSSELPQTLNFIFDLQEYMVSIEYSIVALEKPTAPWQHVSYISMPPVAAIRWTMDGMGDP